MKRTLAGGDGERDICYLHAQDNELWIGKRTPVGGRGKVWFCTQSHTHAVVFTHIGSVKL